jgi:hypothetical protein
MSILSLKCGAEGGEQSHLENSGPWYSENVALTPPVGLQQAAERNGKTHGAKWSVKG